MAKSKSYCEKYFYPEKYNTYKCEQNDQRVCPCECYSSNWCSRKLSLDNKEFIMLDSLRAVKAQNLKILEQNKQIIAELAFQQLHKLK